MLALLRDRGVKSYPSPAGPPPDLSDLITSLKDPDVRARWLAATILGRYGPLAKSAVPALVELTKDANPRVAAEAVAALRRINPESAD